MKHRLLAFYLCIVCSSAAPALVRANVAPTSSLSVSPSNSVAYGTSLTLTSSISDPDGNLNGQAVDISTDNVNWNSGWNNWSGITRWSLSGYSATDYVYYTPPSVGTYYFRSRGSDTTGALSNFVFQTVTVNMAAMSPPTSSGVTLTYGASWAPSVSAPASNGTGAFVWAVAGYTNYQSTSNSWTPPGAGTYQFWAAQIPDSNHTGNVSGTNLGTLEVNTNQYTITVNKAGPAPVSISPTSTAIYAGQSVTFTASGGSGTGAYTWGGSASGTGSSMTVTFPSTGTYSVSVYKAADSNYLQSNTATATITVNPPPDTTPPSVPTGLSASSITTSSFNLSWNPSTDNVGVTGYEVQRSGTSLGTTSSTSMSITGLSAGTSYSMTVRARDAAGNWSAFSSSYSVTTGMNSQPTVSVSPTTASVTAGGSVTFTASGGAGTGAYIWGGSASGSGASATVTFPSAGSYSVTVYKAGDSSYSASNTASASVNVTNPQPVPVITSSTAAASVAASTAYTYQITATNSPTSYGATGLPAGLTVNTSTGLISGTPTTAGSYTVTISATNSGGTGSASLSLTVVGPPSIAVSAPTTYSPGGSITVNVTVSFTGSPASIGVLLPIPAGWSYVNSSAAGIVTPTSGDTSQIEWAWSNPSTSPITFAYTINAPSSAIGQLQLQHSGYLRMNGIVTNGTSSPVVISQGP